MNHDLKNKESFEVVRNSTFDVVKGAGLLGRSTKEEADLLREKIGRTLKTIEPGDGFTIPKKFRPTAMRYVEEVKPAGATFKSKQIKGDKDNVLIVWIKKSII